VSGILCERRSGYKNAFLGTLTLQRAGKFLNLRSAYGAVPSLRLNVDDVQAELVFLDYAVDATVARLAQCLASLATRTTLPHLNQKIDNELFEKGRRAILSDLKDFRGQSFAKLLICRSLVTHSIESLHPAVTLSEAKGLVAKTRDVALRST
jgi:hypothetical protein